MGALPLGETVLSAISEEELEEKIEASKTESNYVNRLQNIDENALCEEIVAMSIDDHLEPEYKEFGKSILKDVQKFETSDITKTFSKEYFEQDVVPMEVNAVGAGIGGGFGNAAELKPLKFKKTMNTPD